MAEEARPETVRIITSSSRLGDILTKAERKALRALKKKTALTILQADKDIAHVILNTVDYTQKVISLLEGLSYRWLTRNPTKLTEQKTTLLLKNPHSQKMYVNNCIPPAADPLLVTVSLLPTKLFKHLTGLLSLLIGNSTHHVKNSIHFFQTLESL
jgi:hypothetical protein